MVTKYLSLILLTILMLTNNVFAQEDITTKENLKVDFEYAPLWWQTAIGLPDDHLKTVIGKEGQMFYDFVNPWGKKDKGPFRGFRTVISLKVPGTYKWEDQQIASPKIPIVKTLFKDGGLQIQQRGFTVAPAFINKVCDKDKQYLGIKSDCVTNDSITGAPRNDINIITYKNNGIKTISFSPQVELKTVYDFDVNKHASSIKVGEHLKIKITHKITEQSVRDQEFEVDGDKVIGYFVALTLENIELKAGEEYSFAIGVNAGQNPVIIPNNVEQAEMLKRRTNNYWANLDLPYNHISVPDQGIQNMLNSSVRNIFQAREEYNGMLSFQVGPTIYRGLWVVDGAFLLESMTFLGQKEDVRNGIEYLMSFQNPNGSFEMLGAHWKETGIVLWAVANHAKLTGDKKWLEANWPKMERAFDYIDTMRTKVSVDKNAPNYRLIPDGFSDGGLGGDALPEYTNIHWSLNGMKAAIEGAKWLGKAETVKKWQAEYDDFYNLYRKAVKRDMKVDKYGNPYCPIRMVDPDNVLPQKAQWAFLHTIFPGKIYEEGDKLVEANMKMLKAAEKEGLTYNTGWHNNGIWNYFASFHAHALLWEGDGQKAAKKLYAMANHASPTLVWREENDLKESGEYNPIGDMPHNWASAEFIRLVRHLIALERGNELHLLEGVPEQWCKSGMETGLNKIVTHFGVLSVNLSISDDGKEANIFIDLDEYPESRLSKIVIHTNGINNKKDKIELHPEFPVNYKLKL